MALVFQVRGDSLNARYSSSGKIPALIYPVAGNIPSVDASALSGAIGGTVINIGKSGNTTHYLEYTGKNNTPAKGMSVNLRCSFNASTGLMGLWSFGSGTQGTVNRVLLYFNSGTLNARFYDSATNLRLSLSAAWTPTINTIYDIFFKWDGTITANAANIYVDGVLLGSGTASAARPDDSRNNVTDIAIGSAGWDVQMTNILVNEFTIWDANIDPTSVTLSDNSLGSLSGSSRTLFIKSDAFDGTASTDPGIANVLTGITYTINGVSYTGERDVVTNVLRSSAVIEGQSTYGILKEDT